MSSRDEQGSFSAHERVVRDYYAITSSVSHSRTTGDYAKRTSGLRRGLGPWLDVQGKDVIDLGSGIGELCWLVRDSGAACIVGVNLSQEEIDQARKCVDAGFVCADVLVYLRECGDASADRISGMGAASS